MSEVDLILKATALERGTAVETKSPGIYQLNDRPLMLAMFAWPGEDATLAAIIMGRYGEKHPRLCKAIPNARNRDDQYEFFLQAGRALDEYFEECSAAGEFPQVVVSGASAVNHIHALAHRVLNLVTRVKGDESAERLELLKTNGAVREYFGRPIGYWSERVYAAGQQIVVPATQMLTAIWATGQSQLEDQQIHSLRAWIDISDPRPLQQRLLIAEHRAAGARSMPDFDNVILEPVLRKWQTARKRNDGAGLRREGRRVERRLLMHLVPQYRAVEWSISVVKARRTISQAARILANQEREDFGVYAWMKSNGVPIYYRNAIAKRTEKFLMAESRVQAAEFLYALHDPLEAARLEVSGNLYRVTVESTSPGTVVGSGVFPVAGPRQDDELVDGDRRKYTVETLSNNGQTTILKLAYRGRAAAPMKGQVLRLIEEGRTLEWIATVGSNAKKRTTIPAWLYSGTTPPGVLRAAPTHDLLASLKQKAAKP